MTNFKIRSMVNYDTTIDGTQVEIHDKPSDTKPDMTYSIQQMLQRHANGANFPLLNGHYFSGDTEGLPDIRKLDLVEVDEAIAAARAAVKQHGDKLNKDVEDKRKDIERKRAAANAAKQASQA